MAGENKSVEVYEYKLGLMQDVVYDVYGGFEDWAYGASWDKLNVPSCAENFRFRPEY